MMDFGQQPETKHKPKKTTRPNKPALAAALIVLIALVALLFWQKSQNHNPIPNNVSSQAGFKTIYPTSKTGPVDPGSYQYQPDEKTLTFKSRYQGNGITFTEQTAPSSVGSGQQVYYQALGLHPYAQFQSNLGPVALVRFYQTQSLKPAGESAFLVTNGTMLIAHSEKNMTNEQWKDLINSLKTGK